MSEQGGTRPDEQRREDFVPRGAIAFMILMVAAYGAIWLLFFFLMVGRP